MLYSKITPAYNISFTFKSTNSHALKKKNGPDFKHLLKVKPDFQTVFHQVPKIIIHHHLKFIQTGFATYSPTMLP